MLADIAWLAPSIATLQCSSFRNRSLWSHSRQQQLQQQLRLALPLLPCVQRHQWFLPQLHLLQFFGPAADSSAPTAAAALLNATPAPAQQPAVTANGTSLPAATLTAAPTAAAAAEQHLPGHVPNGVGKRDADVTDAQLTALLVANGISSTAAAAAVELQLDAAAVKQHHEEPTEDAESPVANNRAVELSVNAEADAKDNAAEVTGTVTEGEPAGQQREEAPVLEAEQQLEEKMDATAAADSPAGAAQDQQAPDQALDSPARIANGVAAESAEGKAEEPGAAVVNGRRAEPAAAGLEYKQWLPLAQAIVNATDPTKQAALASQQLRECLPWHHILLHAIIYKVDVAMEDLAKL